VERIDTPRVSFSEGDDLAAIVHRHAARAPDRIAVLCGESRLTWGALAHAMEATASAFAERGVGAGSRVAILARNSVEYVEAFLGVLRVGATAVPLPSLASVESLELMLSDCDARTLLVSKSYREAAASLGVGRVTTRIAFDFADDDHVAYEAFRDSGREPAKPIAIGVEHPFDVIYSSGTTGTPKGIVHSHGARKASYAGSRARYFSAESVNLIATPFYSNTTCVTWFLTLAQGGTNVLLDDKFSAEAALAAIERHQVTHAMLVPVQYERILACPEFARDRVSSLRFLFSTSAPLRVQTKERILRETTAELVEIYGLTEGGAVTVLEARQHPDKLASVGVAGTGVDIRVVDDAGQDVPRGQTGEIIGRSTNMMSGYLNRPDDTNAMLFRDAAGVLYFKSGDIGRLDEDGFLYLLDRKKDVIISGGFNVYASDIESILAAHPDVLEVAVIGVPSERWGETPVAIAVLRPNATATSEGLVLFANERLGKVQRVSAVEIRPELPKSPIGKVLKRELRDQYGATR
jgi:acyl-CoA synthetase (AMP-forming)/AMP-acid ligase II